GPVERRVRLGGKLTVHGARPSAAELCLVPGGVWVVAAEGRFLGAHYDVCAGEVRYEAGRLRDRLIVTETALTVPPARASAVRTCIALGRVRHWAGTPPVPDTPLAPDRYIGGLSEPARALALALAAREGPLIGALRIGPAREIDSRLGPRTREHAYLVLTAERAHLVRLSELGDVSVEPLEPEALRVDVAPAGAVLRAGTTEQPIAPREAPILTELVELAGLEAGERLLEAARRLRLLSPTRARVPELVEQASRRGHALAPLAALVLELEEQRPGSAARAESVRAAFERSPLDGPTVDELFRRWSFSADAGRHAARELRALGMGPFSLWVHRAARARAAGLDDAVFDAELAEHELESGDPEAAQRLLTARLGRLPPDEDVVLAPERKSGTHMLRLRLHDLAVRVADRTGRSPVPALAALARLEPLASARLQALGKATSEEPLERRLGERAREILACFEPGGLSGPAPAGAGEAPRPLDRALLTERLSHPLARGSGRLATRLSELVAAVPSPDLGFLRDFCEELGVERHPDASRALQRATRFFGLPPVRAYVSHGARSLGLRAFGTDAPFVLVGESHLVKDGPHTLSGPELDFAFGAELAHLAFGHQRVTASEVWTGAAGKTREALVALGIVLPVIAEVGGGRAARLIGKLGPGTLTRSAEAAERLERLFGSRGASLGRALGQRNEELIAAHRLVQLSADRAGIVLAAHFASALRALLLTRADYRQVLLATADTGLDAVLLRQPAGDPATADLVVRIRALVAFYLSPDFDVLLARARPELAGEEESALPRSIPSFAS
ncbi:MAG TPA: hypothetical protein VKY73_11790, partial [Polyangiaceae bacterium]|nr:hypothetical protein [Polyangiaceae bacterium]